MRESPYMGLMPPASGESDTKSERATDLDEKLSWHWSRVITCCIRTLHKPAFALALFFQWLEYPACLTMSELHPFPCSDLSLPPVIWPLRWYHTPQLSVTLQPQPGPPPEAHPRHVGGCHRYMSHLSRSHTLCMASLGLCTTGPGVAAVVCSAHDQVRSHDHDQQ